MIWGGWVNPSGAMRLPFQEEALATVYRHEHSQACKLIGGNEWRPLWEFSLIDQDYILECKHRSHESILFLFKTWCDETYEETKPQEGTLF